MGCSSARLTRPASLGFIADYEAFGLPFDFLIGGAPAVVGALWDVLSGDLDVLSCALLRSWLGEVTSTPGTLSGALLEARSGQTCTLQCPHLTGAAVVCYGIPL
mmetsp:Transcript_189/g.521  ORF Transcript_189/g.521 Transcript_189/m.521 type:complete len:104 (+) Transcript_189:1-312(+)